MSSRSGNPPYFGYPIRARAVGFATTVSKETTYESLESQSRFAESRPSRCLRVPVVLHCLKPLTARLKENKVFIAQGELR